MSYCATGLSGYVQSVIHFEMCVCPQTSKVSSKVKGIHESFTLKNKTGFFLAYYRL